MWQCDNCGYTDEDGTTFDKETEEGQEAAVRYCPECGSDEVFQVDDEKDLEVAIGKGGEDGGDNADGASDHSADED